MRTYLQASDLIGTSIQCGTASGRTRYVTIHAPGDGTVRARAYATDVVVWRPGQVQVFTGGYVTPSTFDAIATALNIARSGVGTRKRVPMILGHELREGIMLDPETCAVLDPGTTLHHGPGRNAR
jgi:hypothetical protein